MEVVDRAKYIKQYNDMAEDVIFDEKLPFATDIVDFAVDGKTSDRLKRVFDFFGDEEEIKEFTSRENVQFTEEDSDKFLSSVISANVTDISQSGSIYKKLMATGDTFRIKGSDCHSSGVKIELPVSEEEFVYRIKDSYITIEEGDTDYLMFFDYEEFCKETERLNAKAIWVRTPMTCKNHTKHGCCPICAGKLPDGVQNIGAFSTLMITEVATQNALSSMNKGRKENVNTLLAAKSDNIKTLEAFYEWMEEILDKLSGGSVERRYYEIALLGRLHVEESDDGKEKIRVSPLSNPGSNDLLGSFIYRPNESSFRNMISKSEFNDNSLKAQIGFNSYKQNKY